VPSKVDDDAALKTFVISATAQENLTQGEYNSPDQTKKKSDLLEFSELTKTRKNWTNFLSGPVSCIPLGLMYRN